MEISAPASVMSDDSRSRMIGFFVTAVSTRLLIDTGVNVTAGRSIWVPLSRPECWMLSSHSSFGRPSPGVLRLWLSVHRSTSR
jgi:hypothetical protein